MGRSATAVVLAVIGLLVVTGLSAAGATRVGFRVMLVDTEARLPPVGPGTNWFSGPIWHVREAEVQDTVVGSVDGSLHRLVSFNLDGSTGRSTAWCSFTWTSAVDTWRGHCRGSLVAGTFEGLGLGGTLIQGRYELGPGGIPAVGPYLLTGDILLPGD